MADEMRAADAHADERDAHGIGDPSMRKSRVIVAGGGERPAPGRSGRTTR